MSDSDRLRDKVAKLAREEASAGPDGRKIAEAGADPTDAILTEIDETILGRALTFRNAAGAHLVLEVSGRRLLRVADAPGAAAPLTDPIREDAEETLQAVAGALAAFAGGGGPIHVRTAPLGERPDPSTVGRSVESLRTLLETPGDTDAAAPEEPPSDAAPHVETEQSGTGIDAFLAACTPRAIRRYGSDGSAETMGDAPFPDGFTDDIRAAVEAQLGASPEARSGRAIAWTGAEGHAVLYGCAPDGAVAVALEAADLPALLAAWHRHMG